MASHNCRVIDISIEFGKCSFWNIVSENVVEKLKRSCRIPAKIFDSQITVGRCAKPYEKKTAAQ